MSLYRKMKGYASSEPLRLHTPGHKGALSEVDITELTDDSFPSVELARAEARAAQVFGAKHARYLCGGSSQGVKSAVFYAGANAVVDINSHRSVFDGFKLSGKRCVTAGERGDVRPLTVAQIDKKLTGDTGAVLVTTPTYYGFCADVDGIAEYCKRKGLLFIIDGAHGAHFGFSERLPKSFAGACDICNLSAHKTLFALTQSALLFDNLSDEQSARLGEAVDVMGSTSPSYLLYASIEHAVEKAAESETRAAYDALFAPIESVRREFAFLKNDDFTRLVLDCEAEGVDAVALNAELAAGGVYSEMVDGRRIVFLFTAADNENGVERLAAALRDGLRKLR